MHFYYAPENLLTGFGCNNRLFNLFAVLFTCLLYRDGIIYK